MQKVGRGIEPLVTDAREVMHKARRIGQKCDRRDAFEICDGLRRDIYTSVVYVADAKVLRLRRILSRRRHFVRVCTREINAAKFVLRSAGLQGEASSLTTWRAWQKLLSCPAVKSVREHLHMHADLWRVSQEKVVLLEKELREALCPRHGYRRTVIITAHRLARILYAMWRKKQDFDANKLNVVQEEGVYPKKYYWRMKTLAQQAVVA